MKLKKPAAIIAAVALVTSFALFLTGRVSYIVFLAAAIITALLAYKIIPKMKE